MEKDSGDATSEIPKPSYVRLRAGNVAFSEEVLPGIVLDYDTKGRVVAVERYLPFGY